jgi:hypothetical protein
MKTIKKKKTILATWLGAIFISTIFFASMPFGDAAASGDDGIIVTILLFSGRPDPVYILDNQTLINQIKSGIGTARKVEGFDKETIIPSVLGYKGILVKNPQMRSGLPSQFAVHKGMIEVMGEQKQFLKDDMGNIEKLLIDEAIRQGVLDEKILLRMKKAQ